MSENQDVAFIPGRAPQRTMQAMRTIGDTPVGSADISSVETPHTMHGPAAGPALGGEVVRTSPTPNDPEAAARIAELEKQNGDLIRTLGEFDKKFNAAIEGMKLHFDVEMAAKMGASGSPNIDMIRNTLAQKGVDPSKPVSAAQLLEVVGSLLPAMNTQVLRGTWDVTPDEEAAAIRANPAIAGLAEPARSQYIQRAVNLARRTSQGQPTQSGTTAEGGSGGTVLAERPQGRTVTHSEGSRVPTGEPRPESSLALLFRQYNEAAQIPDVKKRLAEQKRLYDQILRVQGKTHMDVAAQSWKQS